ncbi:hypothetical protein P3S68_023936 [Capsicum galapagoense]
MPKKNSLVIFLICIFLFVNLYLASENSESENPDSFDEIDTESNMELDWWFPWYRHWWFHPRPWPFVHPPMPSGGFRPKFPYHPWPKFKHPPMSSLVPFPPIGERT